MMIQRAMIPMMMNTLMLSCLTTTSLGPSEATVLFSSLVFPGSTTVIGNLPASSSSSLGGVLTTPTDSSTSMMNGRLIFLVSATAM